MNSRNIPAPLPGLPTVAACGLVVGLLCAPALARDPAPAGASASAASEASQRQPAAAARFDHEEVLVRRGDTLDSVIRRSTKGTPFREDVLRKAFVAVNAEMFPRAVPKKLPAGVSLRVPSNDDILAMLDMLPPPPPAAAPAPVVPERGPDPGMLERKNWVRYP